MLNRIGKSGRFFRNKAFIKPTFKSIIQTCETKSQILTITIKLKYGQL